MTSTAAKDARLLSKVCNECPLIPANALLQTEFKPSCPKTTFNDFSTLI